MGATQSPGQREGRSTKRQRDRESGTRPPFSCIHYPRGAWRGHGGQAGLGLLRITFLESQEEQPNMGSTWNDWRGTRCASRLCLVGVGCIGRPRGLPVWQQVQRGPRGQ